MNVPRDVVNQAIEALGFTMVQLHGTEPPEWCAEIDAPVIKAIHVVHDASAEQLRALMEPYQPWVTYFLLDTHKTDLWGGTGESFNWRLARELSADYPILLAGGIGAHNLEEAVRSMRPLGVDLSSSVEAVPGKKDLDKLAHFFEVFHALRTQLQQETFG